MNKVLLITSVPPGEAPLWVRAEWVGLALPLAQQHASAASFLTADVLSGPRGFFSCLAAWVTGKLKRESGFRVETRLAIEALGQKHPAAAAWWRENTPHLLRPHRYFVFQQGTGHVVECTARRAQ